MNTTVAPSTDNTPDTSVVGMLTRLSDILAALATDQATMSSATRKGVIRACAEFAGDLRALGVIR